MKIFPHVLQQSEEWFAMRRGRPTASRFGDIITPAKGEYSKSAEKYMHELIAECFITDVPDFAGTKWTDRGTELEPEARKAFMEHTGLKVEQVGFVTRDDGVVGFSPDGLIVGELAYEAHLEMKCPLPKQHVANVMAVQAGKIPDDYKAQIHGGLVVTGFPRAHFWSYCPGMAPAHLIVERDEFTGKLEACLNRFILEYAAARTAIIPKLKVSKAA